MSKIDHPYHQDSMWKGASSNIFKNAQHLRENMTDAELLLWEKLKGNKFHGLKFRRQHPIHKYIADFYCHKLKLIIEIDGGYHQKEDQIEYDAKRTDDLIFNDIRVIRFSNEDVKNDIKKVLTEIEKVTFLKSSKDSL